MIVIIYPTCNYLRSVVESDNLSCFEDTMDEILANSWLPKYVK